MIFLDLNRCGKEKSEYKRICCIFTLMNNKGNYINNWIEQAEDDWRAVNALFQGKNYLQSLFFGHLVIEKLCKALWIKHNDSNIPPRTHNLLFILSKVPINVPEDKSELLLKLNRFQLESRYPENIAEIKNICDQKYTSGMINEINNLKQWLLEMLQ